MPKRRMTPARKRQIAGWQRAGAKARKNLQGTRIKKWTAAELKEPRRLPNTTQQQVARLEALKKKVGTYALESTKPYSTGKTVRIYNYTTPERATKILKEGFSYKGGTFTMYNNLDDAKYMYGTLPQAHKRWAGYGKALVSVRVPHRMVKVDESMNTFNPPPMRVAISNLKGRKFKRHK